jgi:DNA-binding MarR family transcriptional regulator
MPKRPPATIRDHGREILAELLARADHLLSGSFDEQMKRHGLMPTQWRALAALGGRDGMTMTELADRLLVQQSTLTKIVDRLERQALAQRWRRSATEEDRRRTSVFLTQRGRRVATSLRRRVRQHDAAVSSALGNAAARNLVAALDQLMDRLAELARRQPLPRSRGMAASQPS